MVELDRDFNNYGAHAILRHRFQMLVRVQRASARTHAETISCAMLPPSLRTTN